MLERKQDSLATVNGTAPGPLGSYGPPSEQELSLSEILRTIFKRKLIILTSAAIVFCAVAIYSFIMKPVYESVVRLQIDPSRSSNLGLDDMISEKLGTGGDTNNRLMTEIKVIESDTVAMNCCSFPRKTQSAREQ